MFQPVLTKKDFTRRYALGEFGNRTRTWTCFGDVMNAITSGTVRSKIHFRNKTPGGWGQYDVPPDERSMLSVANLAAREGHSLDSFYFSEMAPTEHTVIQGEVMRSPRGLYLLYSTLRSPMRQALKERSLEAIGLEAKLLLETLMPTRDYNWLMELLDLYDGHVIEFSTYSVCFGTDPRFKTAFWEVRNY